MKPALNAVTLRPGLGLEEFVRVASEAGFKGVEFAIEGAGDYANSKSVAALKQLFESHDILPAQWGLPVPFMGEEGEVDSAIQGLPHLCQLAREIGADTAMIVVPFRTALPMEQARETLTRQIRKAARAVAPYGIRLALEFIGLRFQKPGERDFIIDLRQTLDLMNRIEEPNVGVMLDCFHFYTGGSQIADLRATPGEKLHMIHVDDAPAGPVDSMTDSMRVLPGQGIIGVAELLAECRRIGYDGFVSLELFSEEMSAMEPLEAAVIGFQATQQVIAEAMELA
jgi:sugar phosphate isomerase/epimerase